MTIGRAYAAYRLAEAKLTVLLDTAFPVGKRVTVVHNRPGTYWTGEIAGVSYRGHLRVRHPSGKVHNKFWKDVWSADDA